MRVPPLETERLLIRPFTMDDLEAIHRILDLELGDAEMGTEGAQGIEGRKQWLQWTVMNYEELAKLYQPPYGDRAITLKATGEVIGAAGYVPCLMPFGQLPSLRTADDAMLALSTTEFGLFWAIAPAHQRKGYASEAARALIDYAFTHLHLKRIVATTDYENVASTGVMRKVGMRIDQNPYSDPPWLQVVGILDNNRGA